MGTALNVEVRNGVPFELARRVLGRFVPEDPDGQLRVALRPLFHYPRRAQESPTPRIKGDLRLPTAQRAQLNFAFAGRHLLQAGVTRLEITVVGRVSEADTAFLQAIAEVLPVTVILAPSLPADGERSGSRDGEDGTVDADDTVDAETKRVMAAVDAVVTAGDEDRSQLWCRTLAGCLSSGDPWTARWVAQKAIDGGVAVDAEMAILLGSAHLYSGTGQGIHTARDLFRIALDDTIEDKGRVRALALYNLAVLEMRYLPHTLRAPESISGMVDEAWRILVQMPFEQVASEIVLVANARALYLLDSGRGEQACQTLTETIELIVRHGYGQTTAHAILLNNLGRASARTAGAAENPLARRALEESVRIDPQYPEGWLELAHFLAQIGSFDEAITAARSGLELVDMFPEMHDVLGYCLAALARHDEAGRAYQDGVRVGGDRVELGLAAARQFLLTGDVARANHVLAAIPADGGDRDTRAQIAVLGLEAEQSHDAAYVEGRLTEIVARFPDSALARDNLAAARDWQASITTVTGS
ncbi:MAG: hypothetical protein ACRDRH_05490 [Pseudonocardia sp.]